jgi:hypothetical protein
MTGRPSSLTPEVHKQIVDAILRGAYIETAAQAAGVSKKSFYQWLKIGKQVNDWLAESVEGQEPDITPHQADCANFSNAVNQAIAESELNDIEVINGAAETGTWQAAAWKLERKHHQRWGRKVAVTDHEGGNFFEGMAAAWAKALAADQPSDDYIEGELGSPLIEGGNGRGT